MKDLKYGGNMYLIVVYDIKQEGNYYKRQRFVFKTCKKYLRHIQNSVFEGELDRACLLYTSIDEIDENWDQYIALPSSYDVHEYQIMQDFILNLKNKDIRDQLWNTIHGKGAFRRFKDLAARFGVLEDWFLYLNQQYRKIAIKWCRENNIIYVE